MGLEGMEVRRQVGPETIHTVVVAGPVRVTVGRREGTGLSIQHPSEVLQDLVVVVRQVPLAELLVGQAVFMEPEVEAEGQHQHLVAPGRTVSL